MYCVTLASSVKGAIVSRFCFDVADEQDYNDDADDVKDAVASFLGLYLHDFAILSFDLVSSSSTFFIVFP